MDKLTGKELNNIMEILKEVVKVKNTETKDVDLYLGYFDDNTIIKILEKLNTITGKELYNHENGAKTNRWFEEIDIPYQRYRNSKK